MQLHPRSMSVFVYMCIRLLLGRAAHDPFHRPLWRPIAAEGSLCRRSAGDYYSLLLLRIAYAPRDSCSRLHRYPFRDILPPRYFGLIICASQVFIEDVPVSWYAIDWPMLTLSGFTFVACFYDFRPEVKPRTLNVAFAEIDDDHFFSS